VRFLELLASLGAVQGALLLLLILFRFRHQKNVALALLVLVFSLRLGTIPSWNMTRLLADKWLWPATTPLPFLFGPLLYWYARELSSDGPAAPPLLPLHFLPYVAETVAVWITVSGMNSAEYREFVVSVFAGTPPLWLPVRNGLKIILNVTYIVLAGRIAFGAAGKKLLPNHRLWLRALVIVPSVVLLAFAFVAVNPAASAQLSQGVATPFVLLAAAMAALIYIFSLLVLIAPEAPALAGLPARFPPAPAVPDDECRYIADRVHKYLAAGAFQEPELTLAVLSSELGIHPNRLSYAVNHSCGIPFRKLLNRSRLSYFIRRVDQGALENQTILELAFEAGFPSKSTFNRVFKDETGMAPSEYMFTQQNAKSY